MSRIRCDSWSPLQQSVGEWAERTFPQSSPLSVALHLQEEAQEVLGAIKGGVDAGVEEEAADCLLLLFHLAHKQGFSLIRAAARKHAVNMEREYETDGGGKGYWKHVDPAPRADAGSEGA